MKRKKKILNLVQKAYSENRRIIAPLAGFPGCGLIGSSIKLTQQNHGLHFSCINSLFKLFAPDVAFMMMDLSVEANALGLPVRFPTHESSSVEKHPLENIHELDHYRRINILQDARIHSYIKTMELTATTLPKEILKCAYVIGPVTLAGLLESAQRVAMDSILEPERLSRLCAFSTEIIQKYALAMVNAGANIICVLDPTAAILGPKEFRKFSGHYVHHIMESYKYSNVETIYHVCGNTMHLVKEMVSIGVSGISLDGPETGIDMIKIAKMVPEDVILFGNISPTVVLVNGTVKEVKEATVELLENMKPYPNFILSTGCDLPPETPIKNIKAFMEAGRNFR